LIFSHDQYEFHPVKRYHLSTGGFRQAQFSADNANAVVTVDDQGSLRTWAVHTGSNASTTSNASAGPAAAATAALAPVLASTMVGSGPLDGIALLPEVGVCASACVSKRAYLCYGEALIPHAKAARVLVHKNRASNYLAETGCSHLAGCSSHQSTGQHRCASSRIHAFPTA